jgi:hypothetical protein
VGVSFDPRINRLYSERRLTEAVESKVLKVLFGLSAVAVKDDLTLGKGEDLVVVLVDAVSSLDRKQRDGGDTREGEKERREGQ